eukprot:TRINITY_DN6075_c0_g1_i7.p1 TRINITY_DN6075_c0_g1~~TRINITY_DN6075_c0_g1_i7.p1  ORF type:complete len:304 (+),score=58.09 TRINITY_DN6075_c0_g1_i7:703-1614(+)
MYLLMELVRGKEMLEVIRETGKYTEADASDKFRQILTAIEYLHSQGVCHRDLKPNNILVSEDDVVKIVDFNVAKFSDKYKDYDSFSKNNYQMLTYTGTIAFTAPEVFQGGEYSEAVDLWSAGAVLYTMLCGHQPFQAEFVRELIDLILEGNLNFDQEPWPSISSEAKDLILNCLLKNPEERIVPVKALEHPWIKDNSRYDHDLSSVRENLEKNNRKLIRSENLKEKLKQKGYTLRGCRSLSDLLGERGRPMRAEKKVKTWGVRALATRLGDGLYPREEEKQSSFNKSSPPSQKSPSEISNDNN